MSVYYQKEINQIRNYITVQLKQFLESRERYFLEIIEGRRHHRSDRLVLGFLFVASRFYRMAVQFRLWLYDKRFFRNHATGCQVVSIGNLTCGGTGKTPVVEVFAKSLTKQGRKVAILSRGYRSKEQRKFYQKLLGKLSGRKRKMLPPRVVSDGHDLLLQSDAAGDEPYMLASNLQNVAVLVDKDRVNAGLYAIDEYKIDTLILDDGFQYLRLKAHINIVLVDSTSPFGNHHVLPRGLLREPIKNIRRADYVFLTKSNGGNHLRHLKTFIRRHNRRAEIIECCHKPQNLVTLEGRNILPLSALKGAKVAALSAIARPDSFERFLEDFGADLVLKDHFADHHRYTQQEIIDFVNQAKAAGAEMIVTTEKDAVRIPRLDRCDVPILYLRIQIDILSGQESFNQCISRICFM